MSLLDFKPEADPALQKKLRIVRTVGLACLLALLALTWASMFVSDRLFWTTSVGVVIGAGFLETLVRRIKASSKEPPAH